MGMGIWTGICIFLSLFENFEYY